MDEDGVRKESECSLVEVRPGLSSILLCAG
jgi:hypothetical protein